MIKKFKNKHSGDRIFIIGNGPSLSETPLNKLTSEYTIATNLISKIYHQTEWRPTYYSYTKDLNEYHKTYVKEAIQSDSICILNSEHKKEFTSCRDINYVDVDRINDSRIECLNNPEFPNSAREYWSDDISKCIFQYNTSLYSLFQIANYMGFDKIYLIGCDLGMDTTDHVLFKSADDIFIEWAKRKPIESQLLFFLSFVIQSKKPIRSATNGIYTKSLSVLPGFSAGHDYHFTDDYLSSKKIKRGVDDAQRRAHKLARQKLSRRGVEIYNATLGGELEVHPRVNLRDII